MSESGEVKKKLKMHHSVTIESHEGVIAVGGTDVTRHHDDDLGGALIDCFRAHMGWHGPCCLLKFAEMVCEREWHLIDEDFVPVMHAAQAYLESKGITPLEVPGLECPNPR